MDDPRPDIPLLDYGHHETAPRPAARIAAERLRQDHLNVVLYWLFYFGGPWYVGTAIVAGIVAGVGVGLATRGNLFLCLWATGIVVVTAIRLRPRRPEW